MKYLAVFVFAVATQAAVVYDNDPIGVNGGGSGHLTFFQGIPIEQGWSLAFEGSDGVVSVRVDAMGTTGFMGMGVAVGPDILGSQGTISDSSGNSYSGYAEYSLGTVPETALLLTLYELTGGSPLDPGAFTAVASVPIWAYHVPFLIHSIPNGNYLTQQYLIGIHTPEPAAWQLFGMGGLALLAIRRYGVRRIANWRKR